MKIIRKYTRILLYLNRQRTKYPSRISLGMDPGIPVCERTNKELLSILSFIAVLPDIIELPSIEGVDLGYPDSIVKISLPDISHYQRTSHDILINPGNPVEQSCGMCRIPEKKEKTDQGLKTQHIFFNTKKERAFLNS